jgi:hypothetical protein
MGMEILELCMEIEDEFEITILDEDAEKLQTVGQTADYLLSRLRVGWRDGVPVCATARAFYRLRAELGNRFNVPRRSVRLEQRMGDLLPNGIERGAWNRIAARSNLRGERIAFRRLFKRDSHEANVTVRELIRDGAKPFSGFPPVAWRIWPRLVAIVAKVANVPETTIRRETRYIGELF